MNATIDMSIFSCENELIMDEKQTPSMQREDMTCETWFNIFGCEWVSKTEGGCNIIDSGTSGEKVGAKPISTDLDLEADHLQNSGLESLTSRRKTMDYKTDDEDSNILAFEIEDKTFNDNSLISEYHRPRSIDSRFHHHFYYIYNETPKNQLFEVLENYKKKEEAMLEQKFNQEELSIISTIIENNKQQRDSMKMKNKQYMKDERVQNKFDNECLKVPRSTSHEKQIKIDLELRLGKNGKIIKSLVEDYCESKNYSQESVENRQNGDYFMISEGKGIKNKLFSADIELHPTNCNNNEYNADGKQYMDLTFEDTYGNGVDNIFIKQSQQSGTNKKDLSYGTQKLGYGHNSHKAQYCSQNYLPSTFQKKEKETAEIKRVPEYNDQKDIESQYNGQLDNDNDNDGLNCATDMFNIQLYNTYDFNLKQLEDISPNYNASKSNSDDDNRQSSDQNNEYYSGIEALKPKDAGLNPDDFTQKESSGFSILEDPKNELSNPKQNSTRKFDDRFNLESVFPEQSMNSSFHSFLSDKSWKPAEEELLFNTAKYPIYKHTENGRTYPSLPKTLCTPFSRPTDWDEQKLNASELQFKDKPSHQRHRFHYSKSLQTKRSFVANNNKHVFCEKNSSSKSLHKYFGDSIFEPFDNEFNTSEFGKPISSTFFYYKQKQSDSGYPSYKSKSLRLKNDHILDSHKRLPKQLLKFNSLEIDHQVTDTNTRHQKATYRRTSKHNPQLPKQKSDPTANPEMKSSSKYLNHNVVEGTHMKTNHPERKIIQEVGNLKNSFDGKIQTSLNPVVNQEEKQYNIFATMRKSNNRIEDFIRSNGSVKLRNIPIKLSKSVRDKRSRSSKIDDSVFPKKTELTKSLTTNLEKDLKRPKWKTSKSFKKMVNNSLKLKDAKEMEVDITTGEFYK